MSSAYGAIAVPPGAEDGCGHELHRLPLRAALGSGEIVVLDSFQERDVSDGHRLLNLVIEEGLSWPFEIMLDVDAFKGYFLSHNAFVVRAVDSGHVMGVFYIKPNFPGRCSHICNGGFITEPAFRGRGVGTLMAKAFLWLARDIGYKASYFNLVFANNAASQALWDGLGFTRLAVVPKAGRLKGVDGLVDAIQYYYDLESLRDADNFLRTLSSEAEA